MTNILFNHCHLSPSDTPVSAPAVPSTSRRLLSIRIALELCGVPPLSTTANILLARYVAGRVPLAAIMPTLLQG
ncbi:hypothetical protein [Hymenobacter sp. GOD-10R]|uniref:hypothetical protein n=1 Tax=Hymenobacter sp. GOD-10R TaxID=3093922 RepID=UPI002D7A0438|nr:hypothetical protein [Hymenobacter sp. GOD-10R]WRQ26607.1 hypothetical protein SD425_16160 [Hymenobacter sp. GOD-10R]